MVAFVFRFSQSFKLSHLASAGKRSLTSTPKLRRQQDKELSNKIIDNELSGVFNWVLAGLERLLNQKNFSKCDAIDNALSEYQNSSDSVKMFIDEECYQKDTDHYTTIKELYPLYKIFCNDDGYYPVGKSKFMKRLTHHKIFVKRIDVGNVAYIKKDFSNGFDL